MPHAQRLIPAGFTLLEVLIALSVLSIALVAVIQSVSVQADHTAYLRQQTLAQWVAQNRLVEMQIQGAGQGTKQTQGDTELGQHRWYWQAKLEDTPEADLQRITISVNLKENDKDHLAQIVGFIGRQ